MAELSKSIPGFVERWHCPHVEIGKTIRATMERDLDHLIFSAMEDAISMYIELMERHGCDKTEARARASLEIAEGLSVRE